MCGGRNFYDKALLKKTLDLIHGKQLIGPIIISSNFEFKGADYDALIGPISCIIQGGAGGADFLAKHWAMAYGGMPVEEYKADWGQGRSAGPRRNAIMLKEGKPDLVVAFEGGKGTADMIRRAKRANVTVIDLNPKEKEN